MTAIVGLQKTKERMDNNGYAYFDDEAFENNLSRPCYIPEGAEGLEDVYTRRDLKREVQDFLKNNPEYTERVAWAGESDEDFAEELVIQLYDELEWEFPFTKLESWNY